MQWETPQSESFTRRQVRQVHTITEDGYTTRTERHYSDSSSPNRYGQYVNDSVSNGIESNYGTSRAKRTIYMLNGDTSLDEGADQFPYKKRGSDSSETGSLPRTYSSGSSTGRRVSGSSVGSTGGTKISSVTLPIRSSSFSATRRTPGHVESPVQTSSTPKTESAPPKPVTLPRTSSLTRQRISSNSKSGLPTVNVKYNIKMILGEVKGNGTDGNVYIQLFGAKGNTAKIQLRQANDDKNRFETGQEYKFEVTTLDIGKIERIKLSHDHMEYGTGFHVKEVHIDVPTFDSHYSFPCNVWLAQDHPTEIMTVKDLNATPPSPNKGYTVSVRLGKVFDPYAKLYLQLCGENEESSKIVLRPSGTAADTFQEGKTYKFSVEMPDIGKIERIRVGHDSHGPGKGIFLDEVEVTPDEEAPVFFPGSCWLAEDIGDGRTEREIYPGTRTPHTSVSDITHTVTVRMGEVLNPDATLFIYLIGRKGETSKVFLKSEEPLEREKAYKFTLALPVDIGKIEKIRLGQDSKGYGKGLFIDSVRISPIDGDVVVFPCACWLAEDVWDSKTERELIPGQVVRRPENTAYNLTFKTGDRPYAGTDANVTLQLFGDRGRTEKVMLRQERGKSLKRFDRGRTDRFTVQTMDVGKVERIRLSHDNSGGNPEWYLESLRIEIPSRDEKYFFPCNRWLTGDEDKRVEVEVYPVDEKQVVEEAVTVSQQAVDSFAPPVPEPEREPEPEPLPPTAEYQVSFQLGKVTDPESRLYMVIHGDNGDSEKVYLTSKGDRLRPGKYHVKVRTADVGNVRNVSIGQEGGSPDRGVFVEEVEVCAPRGPPVIFPCRCWLAEDEGDRKVTRVLVPGETLTSPYDISFRLGEVLDPNAKLFMILYGDRGESGKIYLEAPDGKQFEPGVTYKVSTDIEDVGKVQRIYLGNDSPGRGRGVFVEEIEVCAADDDPVIFPCCCWLDENEGDGKKARVLVPGESIQPPYNIIYRLGEVVDPRAKLYMVIDGNRGESRKIDLTPADGGKLKPGERYLVPVYINDIGKIKQIHIGNDSYGRGRGVFVEEIEVVAPNDDPVIFPCRCWLAEDEGDGKTTRVLVPGETIEPQLETTLYNMTFETGDVPFAGTDSMVSVQLCGEKGDTQKIAFGNGDSKSPSGKFKRGRIDKFAVETVDVGKLNKVRIEHNNAGSYPEWFLKEMTVEIPARDESYVFRHNNWIGAEGVDLDPCDDKAKTELYTIHLRLGEVADPKAPVWIQLLGERGNSGQIQIKPGYDSNGKFEKGRTYKVVARVADIGRIIDVRVGQDVNSVSPTGAFEEIMDVRVGQDPSAAHSRGLYVEEVEVTASRGGSERFPCKCWTVEPEPALDTAYQVTFKTGDRESAGTDAKVYFQLFGDKGKTETTELCQDRNLRLFDKGNSDKFKVETLDVGKINKLVVGRDESGRDPDWYLEEVTIDVPDKSEQYLFPCHRWLCGSQREVTLYPEETKDLSQEVDYRIMVKTGDEVGAGTDANVFLQMMGEKGNTQTFALREEGDKRRFERGRMDKFVIRTKDIGKLNGLRIYRDNKGRNPDWLLDRVNIDVTERDEHYVFYFNQWLRSPDPVYLTPEDSFLPEQDGMYTVDVEIGDVLDPNVNPFYQITGKNGETNKIRLRDGYSKNHVFVKNQSYQVSVRSPDVGEITKLRIGDDSFSQGRTIFIKKVTIINKNGETAVFPCNCWLGKDDYGTKIIREFKPEDEIQDLLYELTVKTGDKPGAGTDANVSFVLQGENGETPRITLQDERNTFTRFQAGMAEKFDVRTKDVGKLEKLVIGHDNKGSSPDWYLDEVDVYIRERNERYKFRCGQWIGGGAPNQQTEAVLYPVDDIEGPIERETHAGVESPQVDGFAPEDSEYELEFKTSNEENAGTDCNVFFRMIGEEGETEEIEVNNRAKGYFKSGQLDRFRVRAKNVGRLKMLHLRHDNSGSQSQWLLDEVVIYSLARGERYVFKGGHWTGGRNKEIDIPLISWNSGQLVGQEPDIPDLIDYMQSGDTSKIINAAGYLQHLCYTKESVKDKVRELGGIPVIVRLLAHSLWSVRYAAICLLRNLSFSMRQDANRLAIADCGGIEELIKILQQTEKIEYREAIVSVLCNLSSVESLCLRILLVCLHVIVTVIIITYSEWTLAAARGQLPVRTEPWPAVLVHATRLVRNLSSAGLRGRQELRDEKGLVDCLVWIIRIGVKSEHYDNKCLEHSVCTLRNLSYRLESEVDRDRYDDENVDVDPSAVKEQQSQGCFAGCGGRKKKKVPANKRPMEGPKDQPQGAELIWQSQTVQQYYVLLRKSKNYETFEGSAGAIHNLTACSWKWAIKIRADTRKAHAIPLLVQLLTIDYDPTIRAAAIALRNLCVDSENKKVVGEKAIVNLVSRLPTGEEEKPRLVTDPTLASILCAIHQLTKKSEKNAKYLRKTKGIQRMVRIASDQEKNYSPRVIKIANQVLANLWSHAGLQQQMKSEGWKYDAAQISEMARAPLDYEATSLPGTPSERSRQYANRNRLDDDRWRSNGRQVGGNGYGDAVASTDLSSESDRQRSWGESLNQIPPPYVSDDNYSRGSRSREEMALGDISSSARQSAAGSERDETDSRDGRTLQLKGSGGGGGKNDDLWV